MRRVWVRYHRRPPLKERVAVVAAQGLRSVGFDAVRYLVRELRPRLFAELYCTGFCVEHAGPSYLGYPGLTGAEVVEGLATLPSIKFYWHPKPELLITVGWQASYPLQHDVAWRAAALYKEHGVKRIISLGAHATGKGVQCLGSERKIIKEMKKHGVAVTGADRFIGFSGLVLLEARKLGIPGLGLLSETTPADDPEEPDPQASKALLDKLSEILKLQIDTSQLVKEEREEEPSYIT